MSHYCWRTSALPLETCGAPPCPHRATRVEQGWPQTPHPLGPSRLQLLGWIAISSPTLCGHSRHDGRRASQKYLLHDAPKPMRQLIWSGVIVAFISTPIALGRPIHHCRGHHASRAPQPVFRHCRWLHLATRKSLAQPVMAALQSWFPSVFSGCCPTREDHLVAGSSFVFHSSATQLPPRHGWIPRVWHTRDHG